MTLTKDERRELRHGLLELYDKYKINVAVGIETETAEQREEMLAWYRAILDLEDDDSLYLDPPARVVYYSPHKVSDSGGSGNG